MPLHNWTKRSGWDGVHHSWITELLRTIKPQLPSGYRAYIGSLPLITVGVPSPSERPDIHVRQHTAAAHKNGRIRTAERMAPDQESAISLIEAVPAVYVEQRQRMVAAVELVSPRNKDRQSSRLTYLFRYVGYLMQTVNLLLVDVHRRPIAYSFADEIARELEYEQKPCPTPFAASFRVGEPAATGGSLLARWIRPLTVGEKLPTVPLPITVHEEVMVDLEKTYMHAAADAYLV